MVHRLNINTLQEEAATQLEPNAIGVVELLLQEAIPSASFAHACIGVFDPGGHCQQRHRRSRTGSLICDKPERCTYKSAARHGAAAEKT